MRTEKFLRCVAVRLRTESTVKRSCGTLSPLYGMKSAIYLGIRFVLDVCVCKEIDVYIHSPITSISV